MSRRYCCLVIIYSALIRGRSASNNERCLIFPKPLTNQIIVTGKF